jgi:hypothetical protein
MVDYFTYISEIEQENVELSQIKLQQDLQKYELSVSVLARTLNLIDKAFNVAEGKYLKPESKIATVLLASRFLVSSKCLFNMLVKGYYFEAWILMRNLQENVADCLCFAESNDYAKLWFKKRLSTRRAFKKVRKVIQPSHRKHLKDARDFMNEFAHSKMPAVARFVKFERKPIIKPQERPEFQKNANLLFRAFRTLNTSLLLILVDLFKDALKKETKDIVTAFVMDEQKDLKLL